MTSTLRRGRGLAVTLAIVLAVSSCSGSFAFSIGGESVTEAAAGLIEGTEMAQRIDVDGLTGTECEEPLSDEVGEIFRCTAQSTMGTVDFDVEIEAEDRIFAAPVNVVLRDFVGDYAESAVGVLNSTNGLQMPTDAIDCGNRSVVLNAANEMTCALTDPETGTVFDAVLTIDDVFSGDFAVEVTGEAE